MGLDERELLLTAFDSLDEGSEGYDVQGFEDGVVAYLSADVHAIAVSSGTAALPLALLAVAQLHAAAERDVLPAAVVTVDLYGQCADHDPIIKAAHHHDIRVVEDAAEALGATYKGHPAGTLGDVGIFSFGSEQVVTTSSGGMLVTPDAGLALGPGSD